MTMPDGWTALCLDCPEGSQRKATRASRSTAERDAKRELLENHRRVVVEHWWSEDDVDENGDPIKRHYVGETAVLELEDQDVDDVDRAELKPVDLREPESRKR